MASGGGADEAGAPAAGVTAAERALDRTFRYVFWSLVVRFMDGLPARNGCVCVEVVVVYPQEALFLSGGRRFRRLPAEQQRKPSVDTVRPWTRPLFYLRAGDVELLRHSPYLAYTCLPTDNVV